MTGDYDAQVRKQRDAARDRARKQEARAETAEARIAAVRALAADMRAQGGAIGEAVADRIEASLNGTGEQPAADPCLGRPGFCRPCRTIHPADGPS